MLDELEAAAVVRDLWPEWLDAREKSNEWERWAQGRQTLPWVPDTANAEYRSLQEKAITPWLGLVVQSIVDALSVEGYRSNGSSTDSMLWEVWQANQMDQRQELIYDAACTTGVSYVAVLPTGMPDQRRAPEIATADADGSVLLTAAPEWRLYSSAQMTAFYDRTYEEWPTYAISAEEAPRWRQKAGEPTRWYVFLIDGDAVYELEYDGTGTPLLRDTRPHGFKDRCPIVRFTNKLTIKGRAIGEVEPYTPVASRIDQDVFDRLVCQRFAAWRVRTATGLEFASPPPDATEEEIARFEEEQEITLQMGSLLTSSSPDTKFGSLPETQLDPYLKAPLEDIRHLSAVSRTPPTHLTGDLSNISAEALAGLEAAHNRKVDARKVGFGESFEQCFALSAEILGLDVDQTAQVRWRDMESRSLSQTADAFGKLATMLQLPVEVLWDKLGFLSDQDRERAAQLRAASGGMGDLLAELQRGQTSLTDAVPV